MHSLHNRERKWTKAGGFQIITERHSIFWGDVRQADSDPTRLSEVMNPLRMSSLDAGLASR
jgi:hypothetical protein